MKDGDYDMRDGDYDMRKRIHIIGQSNRYQMKKLINEKQIGLKKRMNVDIPAEYLIHEKQLSLLKDKHNNEKVHQLLMRQLDKKIAGYKQQDNEKKLFNETKFISLEDVMEQLVTTELKCSYCRCQMSVLYENVREPCQWTVDRIDNELGHNTDNYVLACLKCNIDRRRISKDKFLFTKQLKIIRGDSI
jgi:hypothetical protein